MYNATLLTLLFACFLSTETQNINSFERIVFEKGFVDRTPLIEGFLSGYSWKKLINAPSGFGKTTNIDMIKKFVEISVTPNGEPIPAYRTDSFKFFSKYYNSEVLEIAKNQNVFLKHISRYPVLYFNFKNITVENTEFMKSFWEHVVNPMCKEHKYLLESKKVKNSITKICQGTYSNSELSRFGADFIDALHDHFGKKVIVLGDELDAPLKRFIFCPKIDENAFNTTFEFFKTFFSAIKDSQNVQKALLTSALRVDRAYVPGFQQISYYSYSYGHLTRYYFLTEADVRKLGAQFGATQHDYDEIRKLYKGYKLEGGSTCVYGLHVKNYFQPLSIAPRYTDSVPNLKQNYIDNALRPFLGAFLLPYAGGRLIGNFEWGCIDTTVTAAFPYDLNNLKRLRFTMRASIDAKPMLADQHGYVPWNMLFVQFLFEEGYLSFNGSSSSLKSHTELRFPNEIIKSTVKVLINDALEAHYAIPKSVRGRFVRTLACIDGTRKNCEENMNALISLVEHSRFKPEDDGQLCEVIYYALFSELGGNVQALKSECRYYYKGVELVAILKSEKVETPKKDLKGVSFLLRNERDLCDEADDSGKRIIESYDDVYIYDFEYVAKEKKARLMEPKVYVGFGMSKRSYLGAYFHERYLDHLEGVITFRKPR